MQILKQSNICSTVKWMTKYAGYTEAFRYFSVCFLNLIQICWMLIQPVLCMFKYYIKKMKPIIIIEFFCGIYPTSERDFQLWCYDHVFQRLLLIFFFFTMHCAKLNMWYPVVFDWFGNHATYKIQSEVVTEDVLRHMDVVDSASLVHCVLLFSNLHYMSYIIRPKVCGHRPLTPICGSSQTAIKLGTHCSLECLFIL